MSWDVIMIRTQANSEAIDEINSENIIPFKQTEIASVQKSLDLFTIVMICPGRTLTAAAGQLNSMLVNIQIRNLSCCISEAVSQKRYLLF
mgnify:CR=1 FL=1